MVTKVNKNAGSGKAKPTYQPGGKTVTKPLQGPTKKTPVWVSD